MFVSEIEQNIWNGKKRACQMTSSYVFRSLTSLEIGESERDHTGQVHIHSFKPFINQSINGYNKATHIIMINKLLFSFRPLNIRLDVFIGQFKPLSQPHHSQLTINKESI